MATLDCWKMTWKQVMEIASERKDAVGDLFGYLLCSRDRQLDIRRAREQYERSLAAAIEKGLPVPSAVINQAQNMAPVARPKAGEGSTVYDRMKPCKIPEEPPDSLQGPSSGESLFSFGEHRA